MALVPAGCFMMGSDSGDSDEQPVHEQCVESFYIDRTEVTQADFERLGGVKANANRFDGADRPVERITWFEARDFCDLREARLPTEAEWEYAARGPDARVYPWGDDFVADNVVYEGNSNSQTANVGSRPGGASWVGAVDLSGNVWEWVSTIYGVDNDFDYNFNESGERLYPYPYTDDDGREDNSDNRSAVRVLRGGSWNGLDSGVRAANRGRYYPVDSYNFFGFRCALSNNSEF
jgi:formylglycine-generating enzyme required for sulfatase activity